VAPKSGWKKSNGKVTRSAFAEQIGLGTEGFLNQMGATAVRNMRSLTSPHDASGELTDSIMWTTSTKGSNMGSRAVESKSVPPPSHPYAVLAGSYAEHAIYRETTSGIHESADGKELFLKRMKEWCIEKLGINPDGPPEDQEAYWRIVNFVRTHVTDGVPFVAPTKELIDSILVKQYRAVIRTALRAQKK